MKKYLQQLADETYKGNRVLPDGSFISERRLSTIKRVADLVEEIPPGPGSEAKVAAMVAKWRQRFEPGTVRLYIDACKQATKGKGYVWPAIKREEREPTPIPIDVATWIIQDPMPEKFTKRYDMDCMTACKVAINSCLRPVDAVNLSIDNVGQGEIIVRHQKTKRVVRSGVNPYVQRWLSDREEQFGNVYSPEWYKLRDDYRKVMLKDFILRLLEHYDVADQVVIGMDAGRVSRKKLRDVICAKSLRSTGANLLLSLHVPVHDVMAIGGWSSFDIFRKHYLKANTDVWKS